MSYLAFANITELLGMHDLATVYRRKVYSLFWCLLLSCLRKSIATDWQAQALAQSINTRFLDNVTGAYSAAASDHRAQAHLRHERCEAIGPAFCGRSGVNPPPNPGDLAYETLTLQCNGSVVATIEFAQWGVPDTR